MLNKNAAFRESHMWSLFTQCQCLRVIYTKQNKVVLTCQDLNQFNTVPEGPTHFSKQYLTN